MEAPTPAHCPSLSLLILPLLLLLLPAGAWSQLWKGAEVQYILLEKQLAAMYPGAHCQKSSDQDNKHLSHHGITERLDPKAMEWCGTDIYCIYHVTGHLLLASPGNDEADALPQVRWLEGKPATDVGQ